MILRALMIAAAAFAVGLAAPAPSFAAKKAKESAAASTRQPTEKQKAARARMKECGAEWRAAKKDAKAKGTTWRQFSSECIKRKKA